MVLTVATTLVAVTATVPMSSTLVRNRSSRSLSSADERSAERRPVAARMSVDEVVVDVIGSFTG
jgi:hypothetical protein